MGRITVSLDEWIALAASHEVKAVLQSAAGGVDNDSSSGADEGGTAKDARRVYVKSAIQVSSLLLGRLQNVEVPLAPFGEFSRGVAFRPEDIVSENFSVEIDVETLSCLSVRYYLKMGAMSGYDMLSNAHFRNIGLILHSIFCRGESPPPLEPEPGEGEEEDSQGRSHSTTSRKRRGRTDRNLHNRMLARDDLPSSVCWLLSDLMISGQEGLDNPPFESLGDIFSELVQISMEDYPHPGDTDGERRLNFVEGVLFGRESELQTIIHAALRASYIDNGIDSMVNNLVLISGDPGLGKSCLVKKVMETLLPDQRLFRIEAKFDQMAQQQPMSTIANAFDSLFQRIALMRQIDVVNRNIEDVIASIEAGISVGDLMILINLMPSIRNLFPNIPVLRRVVSDPDLSALIEDQEGVPHDPVRGNIIREDDGTSTSHAESSRNRLHYLFRSLVQAMSSPEHPVLLFLDDLQWADRCSLKLLSSLLLDSDHLNRLGGDNASQYFLVIGAYRANDMDESHPLSSCLENFVASPSVRVTNIDLVGMSKEITNAMLSHVLGLPLRLTRRLTDVFMAKTLGNPLHIKTFATSLWEDKILHFSLAEQRWVWDIEAAWALSVDESIAQLLTRKLLRLPDNVRLSLRVVSCFGSHMDKSMLPLLLPEFDIEGGLDWAVREGILGNRGECYKFAHDMLQETSYYHLMDEEECSKLHHSIGTKLISTLPPSEGSELCPTAFIAIGHINRAMPLEASDCFQLKFSQMNLKAGKRSFEASDFESALNFMEHGILHLPKACWDSQYRLTISLYENAALACFSLAETGQMKIFLDEVFEHANCLEDQMKGHYLLMRQWSMSNGSFDDAREKLFDILEQLGETFPRPLTPDLVQNEIESTQLLMKGLKAEDIITARRMTDKRKIWAVKFLSLFILYLFSPCTQYLKLVATRIIKISVKFGFSEDSALGFIGFGHTLIKCGNIENGYRSGKLALLLVESLGAGTSCAARVNFWYCLMFACWKEPMQAAIDSLHTNTHNCSRAGEVEYAGLSFFTQCRLSFFAGQDLSRLEKESTFLVSSMTRTKQIRMLIHAGLLRLTIHNLIGVDQDSLVGATFSGGVPLNNEEELHLYAMDYFGKRSQLNRYVLHKQIQQMMLAFWFRKYEEVCDISVKHSLLIPGFAAVMTIFYEGLAAFQLARKYPEERKWMENGEKAISTFKSWLRCNSLKWNFENRLLLLEAEKCFTENDTESAQEKYEAAIKSAQQHGFTNEEGLANDFCSAFHRANGNAVEAKRSVANARACYEKWGAFALVNLLDDINDSY